MTLPNIHFGSPWILYYLYYIIILLCIYSILYSYPYLCIVGRSSSKTRSMKSIPYRVYTAYYRLANSGRDRTIALDWSYHKIITIIYRHNYHKSDSK